MQKLKLTLRIASFVYSKSQTKTILQQKISEINRFIYLPLRNKSKSNHLYHNHNYIIIIKVYTTLTLIIFYRYHMYCLKPPLKEMPEGSWSCAVCIEFFHKGKDPNA